MYCLWYCRYLYRESDRSGKLLVERCEVLGIQAGKQYSELKDGLPVQVRHVTCGTCSLSESIIT